MARDESDRENLLAEATALVERAEVVLDDGRTIVAGFRRDGSFSVFFDAEPVYQFNSRGELRRAYVDGRLIKAERGRLVALTRQRGQKQVALVRHDLDDAETAQFLAVMTPMLSELAGLLYAGRYRLSGQVPPEADVVTRIRVWLASRPQPPTIAQSPRV
jgi:hypothetical protein